MAFIFGLFFFALTAINIVFICFVLFFERNESSRRFSWLLLLIFFPIIGMLLYILFSGHFFTATRKMTKARNMLKEQMKKILQHQKEIFDTEKIQLQNTTFSNYESLVNMNMLYGSSPISFKNEVDIFLWGKDKFRQLFDDIEHAEHHINMQYFIFRSDTIGKELLDLLCKKARQGIHVRLLYDDVGSLTTPTSFFKPLKEAGGQVEPFFRVRYKLPLAMNYRNHRKVVVIDGKIGYMGGFNVGDEYVNDIPSKHKKKVLWRDTHIRVIGGSAQILQLNFFVDWYGVCTCGESLETTCRSEDYFPKLKIDYTEMDTVAGSNLHRKLPFEENFLPMQIVASGPNEMHNQEIKDAMVRMILTAKRYIYIQTPYFTPDEVFYSALKIATVSGVDVRVMVPDEWDKFFVRAAAFSYIEDMLGVGVQFYHYPGFIHSKTMVVDGEVVTIGSTNVDARSFALHYEINAFFYSPEFGKRCENIFLSDQVRCRKSEKSWFDNRPFIVRGVWGFFKLFSPLM